MRANKSTVNKSQAIREELALHPDATPVEISKSLKARGVKVEPQYVSTVKFNAQKLKQPKRRTRTMSSVAQRTRAAQMPAGLQEFQEALTFIKSVGGLAKAQQVLGTIEQIGQVL